MKTSNFARRFLGSLMLVFALAAIATAQHEKEEATAVVDFVVLKDDSGKPVRNAAVIMHPVSASGKQGRGDVELKTSPEGKASFDGVPYGMLRVQVLAPGFQTFGEDYQVDKATLNVEVRLKRPQGQYSIYGSTLEEKKTPGTDPSAKPQ